MILVNHSQTFTASVLNASNPGVTWSVREGSNGGSVTSGGVYTAPSAAGTYHVVATSQQDTSKTATATVTVTTPAVSISILQPVANTIAPQALICSYRCSLWIATA
jgi:chemotaxis response regulator CheB